MKDTRDYMCQNCGSGFTRSEMVFGDDVDLCTTCSSYESGRCYLIQAEDCDDFQEYYYDDGTRVPHGTDVGVEVIVNSEIKFFILDGINLN